MIKVNLSRGGKAAKGLSPKGEAVEGFSDDLSQIKRQGANKLAIALLIPIAMYGYEYITIPDLQKKLSSLSSNLSTLKARNSKAAALVEEMKKMEEEKAKVDRKVKIVEELTLERLTEVKLLEAIQRELPEKVWLTRLEFRDGKINLNANAMTDSDVTLFMDSLSENIYLVRDQVTLVRSSEQSLPGLGIGKAFEVNAVMAKMSQFAGGPGAR